MDDALRRREVEADPVHLARIAPIGFAHVNLRGRFTIDAMRALNAARESPAGSASF